MALLLMAFGVLMLANAFVTSGLRHLADADPLTRVFNRRAFLTLLDKGLSRAQGKQCLRREDVLGRQGSEEFAIFLPATDGTGAAKVAERLRVQVQAQPLQGPESAQNQHHISLSRPQNGR